MSGGGRGGVEGLELQPAWPWPEVAPDSLGSQPESRKGGRGWGEAGELQMQASLGLGLLETWRP